MKYRQEIKTGYSYSFISPILVSLLLAIYFGVIEAQERGVVMGAALFVSVYMIASLVSAVTSGIFSALVGIPTYYVLRKIGLANGISLTLIGAVIAFAYQKYGNIQEFITGLSVAYGSASGFFFWLGSKHARDESTDNSLNKE